MDTTSVTFRWRRIRHVLRTLIKSPLGKAARNSVRVAAHERYRPVDIARRSDDLAIWLFFSLLGDRLQKTEDVYRDHARLWRNQSWLYRREALKTPWQDVARVLIREKVGLPIETAKRWVPCLRALYELFEGNPRFLFSEGSIDLTLALKKELKRQTGTDQLLGYGPKLLSLLALYLQDAGLLGTIAGAFPVDVHFQRLLIITGGVQSGGIIRCNWLAEETRPRLWQMCTDNGWRTLTVAQASYTLGNTLCVRCSQTADIHLRCPVYKLCGGKLPSANYGKRGIWDLSIPRLRKGKRDD